MKNYKLDVLAAITRRKIKKLLPPFITEPVSKLRNRNNGNPLSLLLMLDSPPWCSPNIWHEITGHYAKIPNPTIFEYGTGSSTLNHFDTLLSNGAGSYVGVEINTDWFWNVIGALSIKAAKISRQVSIEQSGFDSGEDGQVSVNVGNVKFEIRLRSQTDSYVKAFDQHSDVIIVDGAFRKPCVNHILSSSNLHTGDLVMLMEAGRGSKDWWEGKLYGESDYTDELKKMIAMGGVLMTGNGVDSWQNCHRHSPPPTSYVYPMEACKLIK